MLSQVKQITKADKVRSADRIQSLWSGYGEILRVHLRGAAMDTVIVKWVRPPGRANDASHARKCRSYEVETAWYRGLAARCDDACRVPALIGSHVAKNEWLLVLEDLDAIGFSKRRHRLSRVETEQCLSWLAAFHARFLGTKPEGLWKIGTYWHLATRRDELAAIEDAALRAKAPELDRQLNSAQFQTIVHGDAKPANFCFGKESVAAVDFQYVGGGCGMKDVAYLLAREEASRGVVDEDAHEARYLDYYFEKLGAGAELEAEWRALYPVACADYFRFLAGWRR